MGTGVERVHRKGGKLGLLQSLAESPVSGARVGRLAPARRRLQGWGCDQSNCNGGGGGGTGQQWENYLPEPQPTVASRISSIVSWHRMMGDKRLARSSVRFAGVHKDWK